MEKAIQRMFVCYLILIGILALVDTRVAGESSTTEIETPVLIERTEDEVPLETPFVEGFMKQQEITITRIEVKEYSDEDLYWLSRIVSAEARGEPEEGQIAVANVVLNRVEHDNFPDSIKEVVFQKGQFSPVEHKTIYDEPTEEAVASAIKALEGERVLDEEVLFFYNPKISKSTWFNTREEVITIGNHRFMY